MMTQWPESIPLHPWFRSRTLKRKHSIPEFETDDSPLSPVSPPPPLDPTSPEPLKHITKRRRCDVLETGFAHLSLYNIDGDVIIPDEDSELSPPPPPLAASTSTINPPVLAVGGRISPENVQGDTKRAPLVDQATDQDHDVDILPNLVPEESPVEFTISPSLINHLKALPNPYKLPVKPSPAEDVNRAVILYRPLLLPNPSPRDEELENNRGNDSRDEVQVDHQSEDVNDSDSDAMDVEF